jgi:hypothetical protein
MFVVEMSYVDGDLQLVVRVAPSLPHPIDIDLVDLIGYVRVTGTRALAMGGEMGGRAISARPESGAVAVDP